MARNDGKVKFRGFISVSLNKQEKAAIKNNILNDADCMEFIVQAGELGYKVSTSFNPDKEFFTVSLYGSHKDNPNAGYSMSIFHADLRTAITALHFVLSEEGMAADWGERYDVAGDNDW